MHRVKILGQRKTRKIPEGWHELRARPLVFCINMLLMEPDPYTAKLLILSSFLKIPVEDLQNIPPEALVDLLRLMEWMDIKYLTSPIFPVIKWKGKKWQLPGEKFDLGSGFQYAAADDFFTNYQEKQDEKELDKLIAALLYTDTPLNKIADVEKNADLFTKLPDLYRLSIVAYFNGIKQFIYNTYGEWIFKSEGSDSLELGVNFRWWGTFLEIAKSGVFGSIREVYATRFHDLCVFLVQEKELYLAEKRKIKEKK